MATVPRIVVVDPSHGVIRIMRGALSLLDRQCILVEVPTSDDVLEEVLSSKVELVVTAYTIPGSMNGVELATRISHESLETPTIVLADEHDPEPDEDSIKEAPFQFFTRPVAEPFMRGLRVALDGEAAVIVEQTEAPGADLGPVPSANVNDLRGIVLALMRDVGAMGILLADRTGRVLINEGATGYIDREKLSAILGPSFARSAEIGPLIGGHAWTMQYYDGERLDVFGLSLGIHYFMCLIFEGSNRGAFGAVTMFGRRAADQMIEMLGDAAYVQRKPEPAPARPKEKPAEPVKAAPAPPPKAQAKAKPAPEPAPAAPAPAPVSDIDLDALFSQTFDDNAADSLFDPDKLADIAEALAGDQDERVGYDEAINMGILDE